MLSTMERTSGLKMKVANHLKTPRMKEKRQLRATGVGAGAALVPAVSVWVATMQAGPMCTMICTEKRFNSKNGLVVAAAPK